jgi:hypothetical protein
VEGIVPVNEFKPTSKLLNEGKRNIDDGIEPERKLEPAPKDSKLLQSPTSEGILPVSSLNATMQYSN